MKRLAKAILIMFLLSSVFSACSSGSGSSSDSEAPATSGGTQDAGTRKETSIKMFKWLDEKIISLTDEGKKLTQIVVPAEAREIGKTVFKDSKVETVVFTADIEIPESLFSGNTTIKVVHFSEETKVLPTRIFDDSSVEEVYAPGVTSVERSAFYKTEALRVVELDRLETIDEFGFSKSGLTRITLPASTQTLADRAFRDCHDLEEVIFEGVVEIGDEAFMFCDALKEAILPETLKIIGSNVFSNCTELERVRLPESLENIELGIFFGSGLRTLELKEGSPADVFMKNSDAGVSSQVEVIYY